MGCCPQTSIVGKGDMEIHPPEKILTHNGISIRYIEVGQGQPMILLHGFGGSSYSWRHITQFFSKYYRIIAVDLKGFGRVCEKIMGKSSCTNPVFPEIFPPVA
jgi:alpha-beta hydrolase superfamily lysophospholipase